MRCFVIPRCFSETALEAALRPVLVQLGIGTIAAVFSGLAMLGALWCVVLFLSELSISWVLDALGLWFVGALMGSVASWFSHHAEAGFAARLRRDVAEHMARLPASTLARKSSDSLRRLVSDDIAALHHMIAHLPSEIATFAAVPLASIVLLIAMVGPVALVALLPGALASLYYLVWVPRVSALHGGERMRVMSEITTAVNDYARGIRISRIYGAQSGALAAYHRAADRFTQSMVAWVGKVATPAAVAVALLQAVATFAIVYAISDRDSAPTLAAALFFSLAIVTPALRLGHGLDYVMEGRSAARRLAELLREATLPAGDVLLPEAAPVLDVQNLTLAVDGRRVLDGLSCCFTPGTLTAITGPSGSGKTTLLRALAGLERLDGGSVSLAGVNVEKLDAQARQQACLLIPQGGDVLPATVRENLALSAAEASDRQMAEALAQAQIDVSLEADATRLSGGERQRVGLARAFLSSSPVILLDEPTSALDDATARRFMEALRQLAVGRGRTLVMVTHDLALAACADAQLALKPLKKPDLLP